MHDDDDDAPVTQKLQTTNERRLVKYQLNDEESQLFHIVKEIIKVLVWIILELDENEESSGVV